MHRAEGNSGCGSPEFRMPVDRITVPLLDTTPLDKMPCAEIVSPGVLAEPSAESKQLCVRRNNLVAQCIGKAALEQV